MQRMSSCLSGGGRPYGLDLEILKSPSTSTWTSNSSSPSSTLSEQSPIAISTRKSRTPRKRPNQTYNEAAALLSTAYPKIFSPKHLTKPCNFTKPYSPFSYDYLDLLDNNSFSLIPQPSPAKTSLRIEPKLAVLREKSCQSSAKIDYPSMSIDIRDGFEEDFDAESILDEEIEEGIDSIMGNLCVNNEYMDEPNSSCHGAQNFTCYGYPIGLGFNGGLDFGFGMRMGVKAFRNIDEGDWWRFPTVDILSITPKLNKNSEAKKKKKKKVEKMEEELKFENSSSSKENSISRAAGDDSIPKQDAGLLLKLNYDGILAAWSDRGSPFSDESPGFDLAGNDIHARLAQIDLFSESGGGGVRRASVLRYKEKRRTRLFSKKIRYQVRKVNADQRPRMKGRFVKRPDSPMSEQQ